MTADGDDVAALSATEAIARFTDRTLSPVELMSAVIARAEATEPVVNALCHRFFDEATAAAREAERRYGNAGPRPRPLEGIPVGIKEETAIAGQPLTMASLIHRDDVAERTAPAAGRILRAGGIVHARTAAPEFSSAGFTHSRLFGVTRNPWNPRFSCGGSTGGGAAALAVGSIMLANGSDIGGSIRIPASFCGVVGYKPPYGRVPQAPPYNLDHFCHEGPLARTVADCALLYNVMAGPHPDDPAAIAPKVRVPAEPGPVAGWRIGLSLDLGGFDVDEDVVSNLLAAADALREAGATVEEVDVGFTKDQVIAATRAHFAALFGGDIRAAAAAHGDLMTPYTLDFAADSAGVTIDDYVRGLTVESEVHAALAHVLRRRRALICPGFAVPALVAGEDYVDSGPVVNGRELDGMYDVLVTAVFNVAGRCPVISVPAGFSRDGVPTGVQVAARPYADRDAFRVAAALERVRPWPRTAPVVSKTEAVRAE